ncbi:MAG TPA: four-carbon acid sugar kinase family protein [Pelobium sp.]|nr:four-carbon acid sugar kinase family protein [Pelobium sp.]
MENRKLLLAYYGDDFTGSTDALEFLTLAGVKTILFLKNPTEEDLAKFSDVQAIGIAGKSRSMSPAEMETELTPIFKNLKKLNPPQVHYKVCSTFDSAPHVGNIGKAIAIGAKVFDQKQVMVVPAAPHLGRYCVFGNLFARMGTAGAGEIHRLDRHPSMKHHPVTPATESDLTLHLAKQTEQSIGLINLTTVETGTEAIFSSVKNFGKKEILFFDAFNTDHLKSIGRFLHQSEKGRTVFSVGSSGVEMALGLAWQKAGIVENKAKFVHPGKANPLLVVSGSCSPVSEQQIEYALKIGFEEIALPSEALNQNQQEDIIKAVSQEIIHQLKAKKSIVLHTSLGHQDARIKTTENYLKSLGIDKNDIQKQSSKRYGKVLGLIIKTVLQQIKLQRILFAGGDTSSYAASELGITALQMIAPLAPGAPLCKAIANDELVNGIELNFKGGQVGAADYFIKVLNGEKT